MEITGSTSPSNSLIENHNQLELLQKKYIQAYSDFRVAKAVLVNVYSLDEAKYHTSIQSLYELSEKGIFQSSEVLCIYRIDLERLITKGDFSDKIEFGMRSYFLACLDNYLGLREVVGIDFASKVDSYFETQIDDLDLLLAKINGNTDTNKNQKVEESTNSIPEIVFEGVEMEVSDDNDLWVIGLVFCKVNGIYIGKCGNNLITDWKYARPVENKIDVSITNSTSEMFVEEIHNIEDAQESFMRKAMSRGNAQIASGIVSPPHLYTSDLYSVSSYVNAGMCYLAAATEEFAKDVKEKPRAWPFKTEYFNPRESDIDNLIEGVAFILHAVEKLSFLEEEAKKSDSGSEENNKVKNDVVDSKVEDTTIEYPVFCLSIGEPNPFIVKFDGLRSGEVVKQGAHDFGFEASNWVKHTNANDWKPLPYNKERGLYHTQLVYCFDDNSIAISVRFYDAINDTVFGHELDLAKYLKYEPFQGEWPEWAIEAHLTLLGIDEDEDEEEENESIDNEKPISETVQRILDAELSFKSLPAKKQQTAVDYLLKEFSEILGPVSTTPMQDLLMVDAVKKAKEMEKEQIIDAVNDQVNRYNGMATFRKDGKQYYNETYGDN